METKELKLYSRVKLLPGFYNRGKINPSINSEYECAGTIIRVTRTKQFVYQVKWDNGIPNAYRENELILIKDDRRGQQTLWQ